MSTEQIKILTLTIDIEVVMEDENDDTDWVIEAVKDDPKMELILGGYRFGIARIEEAPSSATETVKPFGTGALCEEDPEREGYCAYHHSGHGSR